MKKIILTMLITLMVIVSAGCAPPSPLNFEGEVRTVDSIEEELEDRIEEENEDVDLELDIYHETED